MNALAALPDIGLDLRKLPDLTDSVTRARLSPPAIAAFFAIVDKWQLRNEDAMALLGGASHGRYYELKKNRKGAALPGRTHTRLAPHRHFQGAQHSLQPAPRQPVDLPPQLQSHV